MIVQLMNLKKLKVLINVLLINFHYLKKCLFNNETIRCIQRRFKRKPGLINAIEINKVAIKSKDNKRLRSFDGITTYPYGTSAFKVCKSEIKK